MSSQPQPEFHSIGPMADPDDDSRSWQRGQPHHAAIEQKRKFLFKVWLKDSDDLHVVGLAKEPGGYSARCDCKGFFYSEGPCAHIITVRRAAFGHVDDMNGNTVTIHDVKELEGTHVRDQR